MKEIEVKILDVNREKIVKKLLKFGAEKILDETLLTKHFDTKENKLKNSKRMLRLRKAGNKKYMTLKIGNDISKAKVCEEIETEIEDFELMQKIIEGLEYEVKWMTKKKRISYKIENVKFEFDKYLEDYNFIPEFLEIEASSVEEIYDWAKKLDFRKEDCKPWNFKKTVKYYKN